MKRDAGEDAVMDFVDWCGLVLSKLLEAGRSSPTARMMGVDCHLLASTLFGEEFCRQPGFEESVEQEAVNDAMRSLVDLGLAEGDGHRDGWKISPSGRDVLADMPKLWQAVCSLTVGDAEHEQLLSVVNRLSPRESPNCALVQWVGMEELLAELAWSKDLLLAIADDLENQGWIAQRATLGYTKVHATLRGLAWETRRALTIESEFIDQLLAEWETTSVDFKREAHTSNNDEKAELIKDIIGLANTQASGRRWMIIGFDDKTRTYYGPPDPKITQNHLEQLVSVYIQPVADIRYQVVQYRAGPVGKLEVLRDAKKLPYQVAKSLKGAKKAIVQGQIFVRHGSQTEEPTSPELRAIQEEAQRERS